jgi:hypothetical protein
MIVVAWSCGPRYRVGRASETCFPDLTKHLSFIHEPRKAPVVLSPDEVARFLEAAPGLKYKAALSVA